MSVGSGAQFTVSRIAQVDVGDATTPHVQNNVDVVGRTQIPNIFDDYVDEIVTMDDKGAVSAGHYQQSPQMRIDLSRISNPNISNSAFRDTAANIAGRLNNEMQSAAAQTGTLFVAQVKFTGPNVQSSPVNTAALLKMDTSGMRRLFRDNGNLKEINQNEVYPEVSDIQKGAVYPLIKTQTFTRSGDIKVYDSSDSDYFIKFLQCKKIDSSLRQFNRLSRVISDFRNQVGAGFVNQGDIAQLEQIAQQNGGKLTQTDIIDHIESVTSGNVPRNAIENRVQNEGIKEIDTNNGSVPEKFKYTIEDQGKEISVKLPTNLDGNINIRRTGNGVILEVSGSSVDKETKKQ